MPNFQDNFHQLIYLEAGLKLTKVPAFEVLRAGEKKVRINFTDSDRWNFWFNIVQPLPTL